MENNENEETVTNEETATNEETTNKETVTDDIKDNPSYIAIKEMFDKQSAEIEKLQKQVKKLQVEKEKMALSYGLNNSQEEVDNAWLGFSRYSHDNK